VSTRSVDNEPEVTIKCLGATDRSQPSKYPLSEWNHPRSKSDLPGFDIDIDFGSDDIENITSKIHILEFSHAINKEVRDD